MATKEKATPTKTPDAPVEFPTYPLHQGKNVKTIREAHKDHPGQKNVADACGVTVKKICELENEQVISDQELLERVAEFLNVDVEWIKNHNLYEGVRPYAYNNIHGNQNLADHITNNNNIPIDEYTRIVNERMADKELIGELKAQIRFLEGSK